MRTGQDCVGLKSSVPRVTALDTSKSAEVIISCKMASPSGEIQDSGFSSCRYRTIFAYERANGTGNRYPGCKPQAGRRGATEEGKKSEWAAVP